MAAYGAIALPETEQRRRPGRLVAAAAALVAASSAALLAVSLPGVGRAQLLQMQAEVRMNMVPLERSQMLCEGHFLDTATGIPEGTYSTLHHPGELEGYAEPLPPEMRAAIDQRIYGAMDPEKYQFTGCIDPARVDEVKGAVGQYRNEHASLAQFAAGHDAPLPHGEWLYRQN